MTRRATPLLPSGATDALDPVPRAVADDDAFGIVVANAPPPPPPAAEPTIVWVCDGDSPEPPPPAATRCTSAEARTWASDGAPVWLRRRRLTGVLVQYGADAPAEVRRAARALRERLAPRDVAGLRDMAAAWGNDSLLRALGRLAPGRTPTFADLAHALSRTDDTESHRLARLCWALEHL